MPKRYDKPPQFLPGMQQLSATELNQILAALPRQMVGDGTVNIQQVGGDRYALSANLPDPRAANELQTFFVLQELDDYLLCMPFAFGYNKQPTIYQDSTSLPGIIANNSAVRAVAKPWILQRTPWDENTVTIGGVTYNYHYSGFPIGTRGYNILPDTTTMHSEKITKAYFPGDILVARRGPTGYYTDTSGAPVGGTDSNAIAVVWGDINLASRVWGTFVFTVEYDNGTNIIQPVDTLAFHTPTFHIQVISPAELTTVKIQLNFGDDIRPVGTANDPGDSELVARVNHIHAGLPPYQTVNVADITSLVCGSGFYYNKFDNRLYLCVDGVWCYVLLTCLTPITPCVPGTCDVCINPPISWATTTLNPAASWSLQNIGNCVWQQTQTIGGHVYRSRLTLSSTSSVFTVTEDGQLIDTYTGVAPTDCCATLVLSQSPGLGPPDCSGCTTTPRAISLPLTGFTGAYAAFNLGTVSIPVATNKTCAWVLQSGVITVNITISGGRAQLVLANNSTGVTVLGQSGLLITDCCSPITFDLSVYVGGTGPVNLTATPDCSAAPNVSLTPTCCPAASGSASASGPGGTISVFCCPNLISRNLHITFTGALAGVGKILLVWDGSSGWGAAVAACGGTISIFFACQGTFGSHKWHLQISGAAGFAGDADIGVSECEPFFIYGSGTIGGGCSGTITWSVTV